MFTPKLKKEISNILNKTNICKNGSFVEYFEIIEKYVPENFADLNACFVCSVHHINCMKYLLKRARIEQKILNKYL